MGPRGQRPVHGAHQPEVHDIPRPWRRIADSYAPARLLTAATWVPDPEDLAAYYGDGDELHLPQYFQLAFTELERDALRGTVEVWLAAIKPDAAPLWLASSHDLSRFPTRWCDDDERKTRLALTMLLTLPGACVLYQGDELGLGDTLVTADRVGDMAEPHRDGSRTPMPWELVPGGGFTTGEPWLPLGDVTLCNVADQRNDPGSVLNLTRRLIALKARLRGDYQALPAPKDRWRYRRDPVTIDLDFTHWAATVSG